MGRQLNAGVTWLGHSTFLVESVNGTRIVIDPFLTSNPSCPQEYHELAGVDIILCTHGHMDHIADVVPLAQRSPGAQVAGMVELCGYLSGLGVENCTGFNKGGTARFGDIAVTMVNAFHSSSAEGPDGPVYTGEPAGFVVTLEDGYRIYHAGDTCVFGDMRIIGELYQPDLAILPIGGFYTMDPREAAYAVELLGVDEVLGMHYGTFPVLTGTPGELRDHVVDGVTVHELQPGETLGRVPART